MADLGFAARFAFVAGAAACAGLGAPAGVTAPLAVLAAIGVVSQATQIRRGARLEGAIVGMICLIIVVVATGFILDALPGGITVRSWAVAAGVLEASALVITRRRSPWRRVAFRASYLWFVVGGLAAAAGLLLSNHATVDATRAPLAISEVSTGVGTSVEVSAGPRGGTYELVLGDGASRDVWKGPFSLDAGQSVSFALDSISREAPIITLRAAGTAHGLRTLRNGI